MRMNIFQKMIVMIILLLIPIIVLYSYSNQVSMNVIRNEIQTNNLSQLDFMTKQMEVQMDELVVYALALIEDPDISLYKSMDEYKKYYGVIELMLRIDQKIRLQSSLGNWNHEIIVYSAAAKEGVGLRGKVPLDNNIFNNETSQNWNYKLVGTDRRFVKYIISPRLSKMNRALPGIAIEVSFSASNIQQFFDEYREGEAEGPFMYRSGDAPIVSKGSNDMLVQQIIQQMNGKQQSGEKGSIVMDITGKQYMVNHIQSQIPGWTMIDYVLMDQLVSPIVKSRNLFYYSVALLLLMSVMASLQLYRHIHVPIRTLIKSLRSVEQGDYSNRVVTNNNNEFGYLFIRYNHMIREIQELIEKVLAEEIRSREATLKHLQSQINPHFLYNCLFYIKNMSKLGDVESVEAMAQHLGEYYRYNTRTEKNMDTLENELKMSINYLEICALRMDRITYSVSIDEEMRLLQIPKLTIQPIVENAILHGIEPKSTSGHVSITGQRKGDSYLIIIEDNGIGISAERLERLKREMAMPMDEHTGCGVWNVHQRLVLYAGGSSGLYIEQLLNGGTRVEIRLETGG